MNTNLFNLINALSNNREVIATRILKEILENKLYNILNEDHQNYMTSDEMEKYIIDLHKKANDKDKFLKILAKYSKMDECSERDFKKCAENIQSHGKIYMDKAIHALEKLLKIKPDFKKLSEDIQNVDTTPNDSVLSTGKIPNVFTNKKIKNKKVSTLKKSVYGLGGYGPNAVPSGCDSGSSGSDGSGAAGDGGASGGGE
jgi:capsid portal protein